MLPQDEGEPRTPLHARVTFFVAFFIALATLLGMAVWTIYDIATGPAASHSVDVRLLAVIAVGLVIMFWCLWYVIHLDPPRRKK